MQSDLLKIKFYFPKISHWIKNKQELVDLIIKKMCKDKSIKYAGYSTKKGLRKGLLQHIGQGDTSQYRKLSTKEKETIKRTVHATIQKCDKKLPIPTKNFIFVFPWFPTKEDVAFEGSFGFAAYSCVLHIFIAPDIFTQKSLANSVAHEINHTISFYYHFDRYNKWSLLDYIVNEGLAENFREEVLHTSSAPCAVALTRKEAFEILISIRPLLHSKKSVICQNILFGNAKYKQWTGYSIGYWLVKEFRKKNKKLPWKEVIKIKPEDILEAVEKNRRNIRDRYALQKCCGAV